MKARWLSSSILVALLIAGTAVLLRYTVFFDARRDWNALVGNLEIHDGQAEWKRLQVW